MCGTHFHSTFSDCFNYSLFFLFISLSSRNFTIDGVPQKWKQEHFACSTQKKQPFSHQVDNRAKEWVVGWIHMPLTVFSILFAFWAYCLMRQNSSLLTLTDCRPRTTITRPGPSFFPFSLFYCSACAEGNETHLTCFHISHALKGFLINNRWHVCIPSPVNSAGQKSKTIPNGY